MTDILAPLRHPPARMDISDENYDADLGRAVEVWLDGYEQHKVLAYDCEAGTVERFKVHNFGDIIVHDDEPVTEVVSGHVAVRWRKRAK